VWFHTLGLAFLPDVLCDTRLPRRFLKSIAWDALDVVVNSGDVGKVFYQFADGAWEKK